MTLASIPKLTLEIVGKGRAPERRTLQSARTIIGRESGDIVLRLRHATQHAHMAVVAAFM